MPVHTDPLSAAERHVVAQTALGLTADFSASPNKPAIRAHVLRRLLLGRTDSFSRAAWPVLLPGVRIRHARIVSMLDLRDAARPGQGLPALALDDCDIPHAMRLDAARIARLSIIGSRISKLYLQEADIDGPFDFSRCSGFAGFAWIDARNAIINGHVAGTGARLRAFPPRPRSQVRAGAQRFALCLMDADIRGSVQLSGGFVAEGGVCFDAAHVRGDVRMSGAYVSAGEDDAFSAQNARIGGMLMLNRNFVADGTVWLHGASINDTLDLSRAVLHGGIPASYASTRRLRSRRRSVVAETIDIGADCVLSDSHASAAMSLRGARIRGSIWADHLRINGQAAAAFNGEEMEVNNSIAFGNADMTGAIVMRRAKIGGDLSLGGATLRAGGSGSDALDATNASIGGDATFDFQGAPVKRRFASTGRLDMTGLAVGGNLAFTGAALDHISGNGLRIALLLERARVEGNIELGGFEGDGRPDDGRADFEAQGEVNLAGASVGRDLLATGANISNPGRSAIYAKDVQVGVDLRLVDTVADGDLRFERAQIAGSLQWRRLTISARRPPPQAGVVTPAPLELRRARIGSALKAEKLTTRAGSEIDLRGLRVYEIQDWRPAGWGSDAWAGATPACPIDFDGLVYDRISIHERSALHHGRTSPVHGHEDRRLRACGIPRCPFGPPAEGAGGLLLRWIVRQRKTGKADHYPQPYRQLARVFRNQGEEDEARLITISERWVEPPVRWWRRLRRYPYGVFFGFGLSTRRAAVTIFFYALIGTFGVMWASADRMLVETTIVASTVSMPHYQVTAHSEYQEVLSDRRPPDEDDGSVTYTRAFQEVMHNRPQPRDLLCTDAATGWVSDVLYAADMIMPFIPLHQETRCEVSSENSTEASIFRVAKAVYVVLGWVVVSVFLGTFAGLLRRDAGDGE
jgi:hypothetical protein